MAVIVKSVSINVMLSKTSLYVLCCHECV